MSIYCVLGAKGQTGRLLVRQLVQRAHVKEVRCVVRDPKTVPEGTFPEENKEKIKIIAGDVSKRDSENIRTALTGAKGVFFVCAAKGYENVKAVDFKGVGYVAEIAKQCRCSRLFAADQSTCPSCQPLQFYPRVSEHYQYRFVSLVWYDGL